MTQDTEKAPPTLAELEGKVQRLSAQVAIDEKAANAASSEFASAVKSGDVDKALELADARGKANATLSKTHSQFKTAQNAIKSAQYAANAEKIAKLHDELRDSKLSPIFVRLEALGVDLVTIDRSEESGKLIINSSGPAVKRTRATGSGGGSRGTANWEVNGQTFTSKELVDANLDLLTDKVREHYDNDNFRAFSMTREAEKIHAKLTGS